MYMNLSTLLAVGNPVASFLEFWAVEHYFVINHFLIKKENVLQLVLY